MCLIVWGSTDRQIDLRIKHIQAVCVLDSKNVNFSRMMVEVCSFDVGVVEVSKSILLRNKRHCPSSADPPCQQKKASKTRRRTPRAQWAPPASRTFGDFWMGWSMMVPKWWFLQKTKGFILGWTDCELQLLAQSTRRKVAAVLISQTVQNQTWN